VPRAQGQRAMPKLLIDVYDIHALYRALPQCVKWEVRMLELQDAIGALKDGETIPGVTFERVIASGSVGKRKQGVLEIGGAD